MHHNSFAYHACWYWLGQSILVFLMLGCRHSSLWHGNISSSLVESTFLNVPTCVHLPEGVHFLSLLAFAFREGVVLRVHLLFIVQIRADPSNSVFGYISFKFEILHKI